MNTNNQVDMARYEAVAEQLADPGWSVTDDFFAPEIIAELAAEARRASAAGAFHEAGIGQGRQPRVVTGIRGDRLLWLGDAPDSGAQSGFLAAIEALRLVLNRSLFLGLFEFEGHFALYPPGSRYQKHLDRFRGTDSRLVTVILYLNQAWDSEDGGELRLYTHPERDEPLDIAPLGGRLVSFLSDRFYHEVLPARRERYSLTGWYRRREG